MVSLFSKRSQFDQKKHHFFIISLQFIYFKRHYCKVVLEFDSLSLIRDFPILSVEGGHLTSLRLNFKGIIITSLRLC